MTRYWVNLGSEIEIDEEEETDLNSGEKLSKKEIKDIKVLNEKLSELSNKFGSTGSSTQYTYITEDKDDAVEVAGKAIELWKEYYRKYSPDELEDDVPIGVSITTQPECPKCGFYGRFSDGCCSQCGSELKGKEDIFFQ